MKRRLLLGGVAGVAALAGVGWAWWRRREEEPADDAGVWTMRFARPEGGELVMADLRGRPLVLNFWATWCAPCVKEMPELDRFHRTHSAGGWQVVGLAIDRVEAVREFLGRIPVAFPIGLVGLDGMELLRRLGNRQAALPFTVVFDAEGRPRRRKLGETDARELAGWAVGIRD
jgi:thiol-disulfide isomerase/thioredoxin